MANVVNFQFSSGESYIQPFTIYDNSGVAIQDITGWTIQLYMQKYADPQLTTWPALFTYSANLITPASGLCQVQFLHVDMITLVPRSYVYSLRRTDSGAEAELTTGYINLLP